MDQVDSTRPGLSLIGAGKLGQTLAYLFHQQRLCRIDAITTRSRASAESACRFIGSVCAIGATHPDSDLILLAVPDDSIESACAELVRQHNRLAGKIVFHCSGSLSSQALSLAEQAGARVASVHPVFSFADPATAIHRFEGTPCGIEGDSRALVTLQKIFEGVGAHCIEIDPAGKALYHCAAVMANNYTVGLQYLASRLYESSGMDRAQAMKFILPILQGTVDNIASAGIEDALTGPIVRKDTATVTGHLEALAGGDERISDVYRLMGEVCCDLLDSRPNARPEETSAIRARLRSK